MTGCPTPLKIRAVTGNLTFQDIFREGGEGKIGAGLKKKLFSRGGGCTQ